MVYFFLTSFIIIFLVFFFYPFIETRVQNYLVRNPQQEEEEDEKEVLVIPTVVSLDKPLDKTPKKPIAVLDFFKRISLYYTQPFIHSIVTYFRRTE
jgi:hypothetical protein